MFAKQWATAAVLLLVCAANAEAQECFAMETDLKYNIPQGVFASNGGCVKGSVAQGSGGPYCNPSTPLSGTGAQGSFSSLAVCCAEVESRTRVDPRNGRPMPEQANVKAACLAYKKPTAQAGPAAAPAAAAQECYAMETDLKYNIPQGVFGSNGGCVKGSIAQGSSGPYCRSSTMLTYTRAEGSFSSLAACCAEVESRTRVDPRNGRPMPEQANVMAACLAYKKPQATGGAATPAAAPAAPAPYVSPEAGKLCYGIETDKEYKLLGIWATYGGCVKGVKSSNGMTCVPTDKLWDGNTVDQSVYHGNLANCCAEVESRTGHKGVKEPCLAYKKAQVKP